MYKLIVTENAYDYLNGDSVAGIEYLVDSIEEAQVHVNVFAKKQFTVIVEEVTV